MKPRTPKLKNGVNASGTAGGRKAPAVKLVPPPWEQQSDKQPSIQKPDNQRASQ